MLKRYHTKIQAIWLILTNSAYFVGVVNPKHIQVKCDISVNDCAKVLKFGGELIEAECMLHDVKEALKQSL